jgi:hypothetical protein
VRKLLALGCMIFAVGSGFHLLTAAIPPVAAGACRSKAQLAALVQGRAGSKSFPPSPASGGLQSARLSRDPRPTQFDDLQAGAADLRSQSDITFDNAVRPVILPPIGPYMTFPAR